MTPQNCSFLDQCSVFRYYLVQMLFPSCLAFLLHIFSALLQHSILYWGYIYGASSNRSFTCWASNDLVWLCFCTVSGPAYKVNLPAIDSKVIVSFSKAYVRVKETRLLHETNAGLWCSDIFETMPITVVDLTSWTAGMKLKCPLKMSPLQSGFLRSWMGINLVFQRITRARK